MPIPEPIPSQIDFASIPVSSRRFQSIEDVDNAVRAVIWKLSQQYQYTGAGRVQDELFRQNPAAFAYLRAVGRNPDNVPAIVEHRRLIQRVNTLLWAYATTHNVITLADMEELLKTDMPSHYRLLGPIFTIPAALEICHTSSFVPQVIRCFTDPNGSQKLRPSNEDVLRALNDCVCRNRFRRCNVSNRRTEEMWWQSIFTHHMLLLLGDLTVPSRVDGATEYNYNLTALAPYGIRVNGFSALVQAVRDNLRPENLTKASQIAQECLSTEVRRIYESFASEFFSPELIDSIRAQKPAKALKHLAKCSSKLHDSLKNWAEDQGLNWPSGYLDSLLLFGDFVQRVSNSGPFRNILHMLLALSVRTSVNWDDVIHELLNDSSTKEIVVDLTGSPETSTQVDSNDRVTPDVGKNTATSGQCCDSLPLQEIVRHFVAILKQVMDTTVVEDKSFWHQLSDLEAEFIPGAGDGSGFCSLIRCLAVAAEQGASDLPKNLQLPTNPLRQPDSMTEPSVTPVVTIDPYEICQFIRRLTCIENRSLQDVYQLVATRFKIPVTENLEQIVGSVLPEVTRRVVHLPEPVIYHYSIGASFLESSSQAEPMVHTHLSLTMETANLFTHRDSVLNLLTSCPSLVDMETWTQWYMPGMLFDRWGDLEQFLIECGPQKVCEQSNIVALRLLGGSGGLFRLKADSCAIHLVDQFQHWWKVRTAQSVRDLLGTLISSLVGVGQSSVDQARDLLTRPLSTPPGSSLWPNLLRDFLLFCHPSLLALLFDKIVLPCLDEVGLRSSTSWATDTPDIHIDGSCGSTCGIIGLWCDTDFDTLSDDHRATLVSAIGTLGLQLGWPTFVKYFEDNRLKSHSSLPVHPMKAVGESTAMSGIALTKPLAVVSPVECDAPFDGHASTAIFRTTSDTASANREEFISALRRREFGCGAELSSEATELLQRVEAKLSRSLVQLSEDLYGLPGHFLLELIQNADDNEYLSTSETLPTLEFCAVLHADSCVEPKCALLVMNNEAVGFTEADMSSLCDIGVSTKIEQRAVKTGRKGIGFKSVFSVTDAPEVHSNGFHVRFHRQSPKQPLDAHHTESSLLLLPEWCTVSQSHSSVQPSRWPLPISVPEWCKTLFVLPIHSKMAASSLSFASILKLVQDTLSPSLMLFLRRLKCLQFTCVSEPSNPAESNRQILVRLTKNVTRVLANVGASNVVELISVRMTEQSAAAADQLVSTHAWICFREKLVVDGVAVPTGAPSHTEISLAVSLTDSEPLPIVPVFSFLPVREAGFCFCINADFDLTSSREDVDGTSMWNQWLVSHIPLVYAHMIQSVLQIPDTFFGTFTSDPLPHLSRRFLLCRLLASLPCTSSNTSHVSSRNYSGLFCSLAAQLRKYLSDLCWLPTSCNLSSDSLTAVTYVSANRLLLPACDTDIFPSSPARAAGDGMSPTLSVDLVHLLMDRLNMFKPHPELLGNLRDPSSDSAIESDESNLVEWQRRLIVNKGRHDTLLWLGAQTISVDALLELVSTLKPEELRKPGLLGIFLHTLDWCTSAQALKPKVVQHGSDPSPSLLRKRVVAAFRHLAIFPLTTDRLARCDELLEPRWNGSLKLQLLLPPSRQELEDSVDLPYDEYIQLVGNLGPLVDPVALYPDCTEGNKSAFTLPTLSTACSPHGLGLSIAYPETVLSAWITPCLPYCSSVDYSQSMLEWSVRVGQLFVSTGRIADHPDFSVLPPQLPIVTSDSKQLTHTLLPALTTFPGSRRDVVVFLPPSCFTVSPNPPSDSLEELESKLYGFFLSQVGESDPVQLISNKYFENITANPKHAYRWFQLFSDAGVSTLLSVHSCRYVVSNPALNVPVGRNLLSLNPGHRLFNRLRQTLVDDGFPEPVLDETASTDMWIIEDFVSPGIELLLGWIARLSSHESALEAAYQLACLLHDNWPAFDVVSRSWYMRLPGDAIPNDLNPPVTVPLRCMSDYATRPLGVARWLEQLRETPWLPAEGCQFSDDGTSLRLVAPRSSMHVYSPSVAWNELRSGRAELVKLLQHACYIWSPGPHIVRDPPCGVFVEALGLHRELHRETFVHLMDILSSQSSENSQLLQLLSPELMIELYQLAVRCSSSSTHGLQTEWLRSVFVKDGHPCIVVRCPNIESAQFIIDRQGKRCRREISSLDDNDRNCSIFCPVCSTVECAASITPGKKRRLLTTDPDRAESTYHLVKPELTCWQMADLPRHNLLTPLEGEEDDDYDTVNDQCVLLESACRSSDNGSVYHDGTPVRVYELSLSYGSGCRPFFIDVLGISSTSSIEDVLRLRPEFDFPIDSNCSRSMQDISLFGHRLAQWYALLHLCLQEEEVIHKQTSAVGTTISVRNSAILERVHQHPILFGADGKWYKPSDVATVRPTSELDSDDFRRSDSVVCLFGWFKPAYVRLIETSQESCNHCLVLAHSMDLLNAQRVLHPPSDSSALPTFTATTNVRLTSSERNEGTAHGLLLDVLGLPIVDRIGHPCIVHSSERQSVIACTPLTEFFRAFALVVELWNTAHGQPKLKVGDKLTRATSQTAFLIDGLSITLRISAPSNCASSAAFNRLHVNSRRLAWVLDNSLYVDSTLGTDLFARLAGLSGSNAAPLLYVCVGLLDDPAFLPDTQAIRQHGSLFSALVDHVCPEGGVDRMAFTRFVQGFMNMVQSVIPDLRATLGLGTSFSSFVIQQLENYVTSHGVRKAVARRVIHALCNSTPQTSSQTALTSTDPLTTTLTASSLATSPIRSYTPIQPETVTSYSKSSSTRYDTVLGNFSVHSSAKPIKGPSALTSESPSIWGSSLSDSLSDRLRRMLKQCESSSNDISALSGRTGELYVYHKLLDLIERSQQKHHNFDQTSDLEFPTGHPLLSSGRVVRCHWCNADAESRRPFDIEVDVQVECDASRWNRLMDSLKDEMDMNVVRIVRQPSRHRVADSGSGILSVGPIYLEVKSTTNTSGMADSSTDLFQMSVNELICAAQQGWRYHLLRVIWPRDSGSTDSILTKTPKVMHVPDLVSHLREQTSLQLCLAMLRTP